MNVVCKSPLATLCLMTISWSINFPPGILSMSLSLLNAVWQLDFTSDTCLPGEVPFLMMPPCWGSYDALVLLCNVLHVAAGQGSKLLSWMVFLFNIIIPEESEREHGCLKQGCQDVRGGPTPAHPTRQLLPARRPSTNNLLWEEMSVCSVRAYCVYPIPSERFKAITQRTG